MSKQTAHEFVSNYYDMENGIEIERKSFIRFRDAMPSDMDDTAIENAYTAFTGESPRYNSKTNNFMEPWQVENYKVVAHRIVDALTHDPTSFTDLATNANAPIWMSDSSLRKCFKKMAAEGFVGCMEIKTCGKCHIRLYYLND